MKPVRAWEEIHILLRFRVRTRVAIEKLIWGDGFICIKTSRLRSSSAKTVVTMQEQETKQYPI